MPKPVYLRNQKERRGVALCAALLKTPATLTTQLPASGLFGVASDVGRAAGVACTVQGGSERTISCPALDAGQVYHIGFLEGDSTVTMEAGVDLYLDTGLGVYRKIISGA